MNGSLSNAPALPPRFLRASFQPPESQIALLPRQRLIDRLNTAHQSRLLLMIAPAGCGKSTLLAQWFQSLRGGGVKCAWLNMFRDAGPADLLLSICWSLQLADVAIHETGLLSDTSDDTGDLQERLAVMLSAVAHVDEPVMLVVDELERLRDPDSLALIELLVCACPPNLHIVLASRQRPELSVSALNAQGLVTTLHADDLMFSDTEARSLLSEAMKPEDVELIVQRTEGWPVALTLAKLWLQQGSNRSVGLLDFRGSISEVSIYLAENVIASIGNETREFLLDVCMLDQVSPQLADALRGRNDSRALLHTLLELRPMLTVLDSAGPVVRLHPLLAEHLTQTLRLQDPQRLIRLHEAAAAEHMAAGRLLEGVKHALEASNPALACKLLVAQAPMRICVLHGSAEISACLKQLPELEWRRHPRLRLCAIFLMLRRGEHARAAAEYQVLREDQSDHSAEYLLESFTIDVQLGLQNPALGQSKLEELQAAYRACGRVDSWARMIVETLALCVHLRAGRLDAAHRSIEVQRTAYAGISTSASAAYMELHSCQILLAEGDLAEAEARLRKLQRSARSVVGPERAIMIMARTLLASVQYELDREDVSEAEIDNLLTDLQRTDAWFDYYAMAYGVAVEIAGRSSAQAASRLISRGRIVARHQILGASFEQLLLIFEADILAREGNIEGAARWLENLGPFDTLPTFYERDALARARGRLALTRDEPHRALELASQWTKQARHEGRPAASCRAKLLEAIASLRLGELQSSSAALTEALAWAVEQSAIAPFLEFRPQTAQLLDAFDAAGMTLSNVPAEFLVMLRKALAQSPELRRLHGLLTKREAEILELLRHSASNKHIARAADISEDAVKFHLKNVYRKLGVHTRNDALRAIDGTRQS